MAPSLRRALIAVSFSAAVTAAAAQTPKAAPPADALSPARVAAVRAYIKKRWTTLSRSTRDLAKAAPDPKFPRPAGQPWPVYLPPEEDRARVEAELKKTMTPDDLARIELRVLPAGRAMPADPGLLYLPRPYVVPGGRFNEMYGWDSYFIQVGLLRGRRDGAGARHGRELPLRDRALRHHPQREPHVLPLALAASVPDRMVLGVYDEDRRQGVAAPHASRHRGLLPVLDDGAAPRARHAGSPATATSARGRRRRC